MRKLLPAALFFAMVAGASLPLGAQVVLPVDPLRHWKVLETEHFQIIYDEGNHSLAQNFANEAERAETLLQPLLQTPMPTKVPVAIADVTDSSNGDATAIPRSQIEVFPVLPSVSDPTSEYYNWDRELITHEYTHILTFEPTSGFPAIVRFLLGSFYKPNSYLPHWYLEGLAVEMESRLTPVGRGRSFYYSALVRSEVEDRTWGLESIDRLNSSIIPYWPRGQRPYTYGYFLIHELSEIPRVENAPTDNIYNLLDHRYGGRIPWFLSGPVEDYFNKTYAELLDLTYKRLESKAQTQLDDLKAHNAKNGTPLMQQGYFNVASKISPDHLKLAAVVSDFDDSPSIRVWTRKSPTEPFSLQKDFPQALITAKDMHQLSWRADSQHIVFDHSGPWKHYNNYSDLYEVDVTNGKEKRLTEGMRAREATVLADNSLVFVVASSTKTQLVHSDKDGKNPVVLYTPGDGERVSSPRPFNGGVIYSHRDRRGREWIESLSLSNRQVHILTAARKIGEIHDTPIADPESPSGFYYAATYSGVMNIYHSDPTKTEGVTSVTTYAMDPEVDVTAHKIIYSRLTADGFRLEEAPLQKAYPAPVGPLQSYPPAIEADAPKVNAVDEYNYHGLKYLFPQYLLPFIYFVPGGALFDVSTAGADPLQQHQYFLDLGYDTRAAAPTETLAYTNATLPFFIDAEAANEYVYIVGLGVTEQVVFGQLDTRHFLLPSSNKWFIGPEFQYKWTNYLGTITEFGPGAALSYQGVSPARDFQISPESGQEFSLGYDYHWVQLSSQGVINQTSYPAIHGDFSLYLAGKPLPRHHVISLKGMGWYAPQLQTLFVGTQQGGGEYFGSILPPMFLVRGYPVGEFWGWSMYTANFEYRFPIAYPYNGSGTFPLFFEKWHGALIFDTATLQGGQYDSANTPNLLLPTKVGTFYCGTGAEIRADVQLLYNIPLTMRLGAYYGASYNSFGGFNYMLSFGAVE